MSSVAEVRLWGRTIGAVSLNDNDEVAAFEYVPAFAGSGIEVSPIAMPLSGVYVFSSCAKKPFTVCPGCWPIRCRTGSAMR